MNSFTRTRSSFVPIALVACLSSFGGAGCGSSLGSGGTGGASGASGAGGLAGASAGTSGHTGSVDSGLDGGTVYACPESVATACAAFDAGVGPYPNSFFHGHECIPTWSGALADCAAPTIGGGFFNCGNYYIRILENVDVGAVSYYDVSTGELVAIFESSNSPALGCLAGPAEFNLSQACIGFGQKLTAVCADGGSDSGS